MYCSRGSFLSFNHISCESGAGKFPFPGFHGPGAIAYVTFHKYNVRNETPVLMRFKASMHAVRFSTQPGQGHSAVPYSLRRCGTILRSRRNRRGSLCRPSQDSSVRRAVPAECQQMVGVKGGKIWEYSF